MAVIPEPLKPPQSWYLVRRSADVPRGRIVSIDFLGRPVVLFRGGSGRVHALSAQCSHPGTHLGQGRVVGDRIQCPLHQWEYDGQGVCRKIPATQQIPERACQFSYPVVERLGAILVYNGASPAYSPPGFAGWSDGELTTGAGKPVHLACSWNAVLANAFDLQHLEAVHGRAVKGEASINRLDWHRLQFRYASRVTGSALTDRVMKRLSGDHIDVTITAWGGTCITVESNLGRVRSSLLLGVLPNGSGTEVRPIFCVRKGPGARLRVAISNWLFCGFLRRDISILAGMAFRPQLLLPYDDILHRYLEFVEEQQAAGPEASRSLGLRVAG